MLSASGTVLVIAAHPDDEVLGCGGTIARLAAEGRDVTIAILGEGIRSRSDQPDSAIAALQMTAQAVAKQLGASELVTFGLPDNRLDTLPLLDLAQICEQLVARFLPTVVFTQHGGDLNVDHRQLFRATLTATRPIQGRPVQQVIAYEVASSTEWAFGQFAPDFRPNLFVDIASTLDLKIAAMQQYESEARPFPHPRSPEALRAQATRWGATAGLVAAEAFQIVRSTVP